MVSVFPTAEKKESSKSAGIELADSILQRAFCMYDVDGDGQISHWEFRRLVSGIGKRIKESQIDALLNEESSCGTRKAAKVIKNMLVHGHTQSVGTSDNGAGQSFSFEEMKYIMGFLKQITAQAGDHKDSEKKQWCIVEHDHSLRVFWDLVVLALLVYVLLVSPWRIGFDSPAIGAWFLFELCVDFAFIIDVLLQFRTSYIDKNGQVESDWRKIGTRYMKGYFWIDLVSSLPWDLFLPDEKGSSETRLIRTIRLVKLTRLGRFAKFQKFLMNFKEYIVMNHEIVQVSTTLGMLVLVSHFLACLWGFAGRYGTHENLFYVESWQARHGVLNSQAASGNKDEYQLALYWAVTTMTTVGFGDVVPATGLEFGVATVAMFVGVSFYGYMTAVLTAWFLATDPEEATMNARRKALISYLRKNQYPRVLRREIQAFFKFHDMHSNSFDEFEMLQQLPYNLHTKAAGFLVRKMLLQYTVFTNVDAPLLAVLLKILKPQSASPSEVFAKAGDPATTMYLIQRGTVNIVKNKPSEDGLTGNAPGIVGQFNSGQSFMEYAAFRIVKRHKCSAMAVTSCALYGIRAADIDEAAGEYLSAGGTKHPFALAAALIRQNVLLLEQFRSLSHCSQIGLDCMSTDFEEVVVSLVLGNCMEDSEEQGQSEKKHVNDLGVVMETAKKWKHIITKRSQRWKNGLLQRSNFPSIKADAGAGPDAVHSIEGGLELGPQQGAPLTPTEAWSPKSQKSTNLRTRINESPGSKYVDKSVKPICHLDSDDNSSLMASVKELDKRLTSIIPLMKSMDSRMKKMEVSLTEVRRESVARMQSWAQADSYV